MSEFIGSRISLISKSDIRYVGTLHEINSETSTVALENVTSFGTEGRRGSATEEIPASDSVYEYIVFRGSDVKDLRIEEPPKENKPPQPPVPNDPAILGAARPPAQAVNKPQQNQQPRHLQQQQPFSQQQHYPPPYGQYPPYQGQRFGPQGGFPPGGYPGYPPMPYGAPPGWYGPPGQHFPPPPPGAFPPGGPQGPMGQNGQPPQQPAQNQKPGQPGAAGASTSAQNNVAQPQSSAATDATLKPQDSKPTNQSVTPAPSGTTAKQAPPLPVESKPDVAAALAPPAAAVPAPKRAPVPPKTAAPGPKNGRIIPVVPLSSPKSKTATPSAGSKPFASANAPVPTSQPSNVTANTALQQYQNATHAATAAVAAAMAKLPPAPNKTKTGDATKDVDASADNLTKKFNEMRVDERIRHSKQPGTGGYAAGNRGGRGGRRGSLHNQSAKPMEVPTTDYDFESANAKFNKQDLVREAIASGSPLGETPSSGEASATNGTAATNGTSAKPNGDVVIPAAAPATYNKAVSFFDNISSELKDREDTVASRGHEFRTEERKKNLETFGQGSVDGGYRGGYRGRGRGRGFRGRGGMSRGRGGGGDGGQGRGRGGPQQGAQSGTAEAGGRDFVLTRKQSPLFTPLGGYGRHK